MKKRDGYRCTVVGCPHPEMAIVAHHWQPGNHDPATGTTLCGPHHKAVDSKAR